MLGKDDINAIYHYTSFEDLRFVRYYGPHPPEPISIVVVKSSSTSSRTSYLCNDSSQFIRKMEREARLYRKRHYIDVEVREVQMNKNEESEFRLKLFADAIVYTENEERNLRDNLAFIIDNMHPKSMLCICCVKSGHSPKSSAVILRRLLRKHPSNGHRYLYFWFILATHMCLLSSFPSFAFCLSEEEFGIVVCKFSTSISVSQARIANRFGSSYIADCFKYLNTEFALTLEA
nr:hypothetical protein HmN_000502800 [Hymenolepis microstoma]